MKTFYPKDHPIPFVHQLLLSGVAPRPIAFVSTMDKDGKRNLSPFSFFNAFGANPPVVVVSPSYKGKDGGAKHTFLNIMETKEFTISAVNWNMLQQMNLASALYPEGVDEFVKAGFTPLESDVVAPPGVAESPFVMECTLLHYYDTGGKPAAGNLLIGEVVAFHVRESAYHADKIDPRRLDLVARMGYEWYCRANGDALFELSKPSVNGVGFDALPEHVLHSVVFTGNDLGKLAGVEEIPDYEPIFKKWKRDIAAVDPDSQRADMFDVELAADNPRGALLSAIRDIRNKRYPARKLSAQLQKCAQAFLAIGETGLAWECAIMSEETVLNAIIAS